ncbi:MAG: trypsin-like peptidase domain-containing protein [Tannerellaceae bacterium]
MKRHSVIYILFLLIAFGTNAQVSHGGSPLPENRFRSSNAGLFVEMPVFDVAEELRMDSLNESDLRSGYRFAYKFMTDYNRGNSGTSFTLPDGTRVWQLGIRSKGALSINILFTEYELPEGAQLFLYNSSRTHILGAFNHLNNSALGLLPISPIEGDELIIEYQEPAKATFAGRLTVGEVNHGYRELKGVEPTLDDASLTCSPPLACNPGTDNQYKKNGRSVVLLIINGNTLCTGALVNTTTGSGVPYLLTASHCLNNGFTVTNPDYEKVANSIVCFFNYDSPLCTQTLRGTEEMSVASAHYRAVYEKTDMALLELIETPPAYYQPYYAGWNAKDGGIPPYAGIHHPRGSVKRISLSDQELEKVSLTSGGYTFQEQAHWRVKRWSLGITAGGSSGSPLFDSTNRIVGALSGGSSFCNNPVDDYYYALTAAWTPSEKPTEQLKYWLDPQKKNDRTQCDGLDPYAGNPCYRLSNVQRNGKQEEIETAALSAPATGYLFGSNSLGTNLYLEEYNANGEATLHGAYLVTPSISETAKNLKVEIIVYSGEGHPITQIHAEPFRPTYSNYMRLDVNFQETNKPLNRAQESYIAFSKEVKVNGAFYVGYRLTAPQGISFETFNLPKGASTRNTSWVNYQSQWIKASDHPIMPLTTSLFIDPVIQAGGQVSNATLAAKPEVLIILSAEGKTIHLQLPENIRQATFTLLTTDGRKIQENQIEGNQATIVAAISQPGIYLAKVTYAGKQHTSKLLF